MANDKPLVIRIREAKEDIIAAVNETIKNQDLPCYIIEPIIAELHSQVSAAALREYEIAKQQVAEKTTEAGGENGGS